MIRLTPALFKRLLAARHGPGCELERTLDGRVDQWQVRQITGFDGLRPTTHWAIRRPHWIEIFRVLFPHVELRKARNGYYIEGYNLEGILDFLINERKSKGYRITLMAESTSELGTKIDRVQGDIQKARREKQLFD